MLAKCADMDCESSGGNQSWSVCDERGACVDKTIATWLLASDWWHASNAYGLTAWGFAHVNSASPKTPRAVLVSDVVVRAVRAMGDNCTFLDLGAGVGKTMMHALVRAREGVHVVAHDADALNPTLVSLWLRPPFITPERRMRLVHANYTRSGRAKTRAEPCELRTFAHTQQSRRLTHMTCDVFDEAGWRVLLHIARRGGAIVETTEMAENTRVQVVHFGAALSGAREVEFAASELVGALDNECFVVIVSSHESENVFANTHVVCDVFARAYNNKLDCFVGSAYSTDFGPGAPLQKVGVVVGGARCAANNENGLTSALVEELSGAGQVSWVHT